jgi:thiol-disulfide isomerase/thioredoxin
MKQSKTFKGCFSLSMNDKLSRAIFLVTLHCLLFSLKAISQVAGNIPDTKVHIKLEKKGVSDMVDASVILYSEFLDLDAAFPKPDKIDLHLNKGSFLTADPGMMSGSLEINPQEKYSYIDIFFGGTKIIDHYLIEQGDSIWIHLEEEVYFLGPQGYKFELQQQLDRALKKSRIRTNPLIMISDASSFLDTEDKKIAHQQLLDSYRPGWNRKVDIADTDQKIAERIEALLSNSLDPNEIRAILDRYSGGISGELYNILLMETVAKSILPALDLLISQGNHRSPYFTNLQVADLISGLVKLDSYKTFYPDPYRKALMLSVYWQSLAESTPLAEIMETFSNELEDLLWAKLMIKYRAKFSPSFFQTQIPNIQSQKIRTQLLGLLVENHQSLDLATFESTDGEEVAFKDHSGKFLFVDFWISGCGSCLKFKKEMMPHLLALAKEGHPIEVLAVSADKKQEVWAKTIDSETFRGEGLTNLYAGEQHPFLEAHLIRSFPTQMLISPDGRILKSGTMPHDPSSMREYLLDELKKPTQNSQHRTNSNQNN